MARSAVRPTRWVTGSRRFGGSDAGSLRKASKRRLASSSTASITEIAERADEPCAQQRAVVRLARDGLPSDPLEHRPQRGARIGLERGAGPAGLLQVVDAGERADDLVGDAAMVVAGEMIGELEVGGRRVAVGLDQRPGVGQEVDAVRRRHAWRARRASALCIAAS